MNNIVQILSSILFTLPMNYFCLIPFLFFFDCIAAFLHHSNLWPSAPNIAPNLFVNLRGWVMVSAKAAKKQLIWFLTDGGWGAAPIMTRPCIEGQTWSPSSSSSSSPSPPIPPEALNKKSNRIILSPYSSHLVLYWFDFLRSSWLSEQNDHLN